jgi:uncharacterized Rossmann fold enzyme
VEKNLSYWKCFYEYQEIFEKIKNQFGFDEGRENDAAVLLSSIVYSIQDPNIECLLSFIDSLQPEQLILIFITQSSQFATHLSQIEKLKQNPKFKTIVIAADATSQEFLKANQVPDFVFSDLDGITPEDLKKLTDSGCYVIVHGHSDNTDKIEQFKSVITKNKKVIGTTQTDITEVLINPGGFTDGDRSLFFFNHLVNADIPFYVLGYDFDTVYLSDYKKSMLTGQNMGEYLESKKQKLLWAKKSIEWLTQFSNRKIVWNVDSLF